MNDRVRRPDIQLRQTLGAIWGRRAARERLALGFAAAVVGLAMLWWLGLAPALATLHRAPQQHQALDAQLSRMRVMATRAQALKAQGGAPLSRDATQRALEQATRDLLGNAGQLSWQGDQATVVLTAAPPDALAGWLEQVRINARLVPVQADLRFNASPAGWSGQLVLAGPGPGAGN
ncbi:MAG: type II secretion system protein GspM [Hydrogenophaga sp.]